MVENYSKVKGRASVAFAGWEAAMICSSRSKLKSYDSADTGKRTVFSTERMVIAALSSIFCFFNLFFF